MSDITQLFMTDPLKLTKDNIQDIVKEFRKQRQSFNTVPKNAPRDAKPKVKKDTKGITLDLGL